MAEIRIAVQNMQGGLAGSIVASEMAAMFEFAILPKVRSYYAAPNTPQFEQQCKDFGAQIGLPARDWPLVHVPAFLSIDNATIHAHMRKLIAAPRVPPSRLEADRRAVLGQLVGELPAQIEPRFTDPQPAPQPPPLPRAANLTDPTTHRELAQYRRAQLEAQLEDTRQRRLQQELEQRRRADPRADPWDLYLWREAQWRPGMRCILLEQWQPLSKVSPELHCTVEHMVGTSKRFVKEGVLNWDQSDAALLKGVTYQQLVLQAVEQRGNGPAGLKHIRGSVRKLPVIARILAAERGAPLVIRYARGGAAAKDWEVKGTAGGWIQDSRWT